MPAPPDLSTPQKTLETLADAYSRRDADRLAACLLPPIEPKRLVTLLRENPRVSTTLIVAEATVERRSDSEAWVRVHFMAHLRMPAPPHPSIASPAETVHLRKTAAGWQIVAPPVDPVKGFANSVAYQVRSGAPAATDRIARVVQATNDERRKAGLKPVTESPLLTRAAQAHADDMARRDYFDHRSKDGRGPSDRADSAGYRWSAIGENIALGQRSAADAVGAWMRSPGHRGNLLKPDFKEIGVGYAERNGKRYWVQLFGTSSD